MKIRVTMEIDLGNAEAADMGLPDAAKQYAGDLARTIGGGVDFIENGHLADRHICHDGNGNRVGMVDIEKVGS